MGLLCFLYNKQQVRLDRRAEEDKAQFIADLDKQGATEMSQTQQHVTQYANAAYVPDLEDTPATPASQASVTQYTSVAYAVDISGQKGQAPQPPASAPQHRELLDVAAAVGDGATSGAYKTKL